jgi:hypothetical protein
MESIKSWLWEKANLLGLIYINKRLDHCKGKSTSKWMIDEVEYIDISPLEVFLDHRK